MSEKTLDELKAEMRKDVELILSGNHPIQKADGVMFIDGYDNCINESRRGLGKLPLIDPKDVKYCAAGSKKLLVVTIVNDEVVNATIAHNRKWDSSETINFTCRQIVDTPTVRARAQAVLSRMGTVPLQEVNVPVDTSCLDVQFFKKNMLNRFNLEKEKMIGEVYRSEAEMIHVLENAMMLGMRRSLELIYRYYPELQGLFDFTKAGFDIRFDAEHNHLTAGFNNVLNNILLWVERNPDKRTPLPSYDDPLTGAEGNKE